MSDIDWRPSASQKALRARADLNRTIRDFFHDSDVMEVETPLLNSAPVADPNIEPLEVHFPELGQRRRFLHTSPEYSMKRLLCAGSGDIYALTKVFRGGERGRRHNPEFTMLEWYRVGWDHRQLMHEVADLLNELLGEHKICFITYRAAMIEYAGIDPFTASAESVAVYGQRLAGADLELDTDGWLDLIMSHKVESAFPPQEFTFVYHYPASQAALAKVVRLEGMEYAERFEVYFQGLELANGYHELTDYKEQLRRFEKENEVSGREIDQRLCRGMQDPQAGLPACAGVAMGVDRILMLKLGCLALKDVLSFDDACC